MLRNAANLTTLGTGFNAAFQGGLTQAEPQYSRIATTVPSTTSENEYGWLGQIPNVREWIGDRVVHGLEASDYTIKNRKFEATIAVSADSIDDDNIGIYGPMFTEMGRSATAHLDQLVWALLKAGFTTACYDGQYFFDTDHPVLDADGVTVNSVANTDGGAGQPWFLVDDSRALKPILLQIRRAMSSITAKDKPTDDNVFDRGEYKYGIDGRHNVGFGFWQFAWGSKQPINAANYAAARSALMSMKGDHGRPLGIMPRLFVCGPSGESAARKLLNSEYAAAGETNEWKGTAELLVVPWLA